jgi:neutral ceramidase
MHRKTFVSHAALIFGFAAAVFAADAPSWQAGTGREKITPREPVWMTGYGGRDHPAEGTAQDLWTKALAFADPAGNRGVLITADLCMISRESSDRVAAELEKKHRLPRSAIMFNVSHTHCGPWLEGVALGFPPTPPDVLARNVAYTRELEQMMVRVASSAIESLAPATLAWGEDRASFAVNRRENPEAQVPALRAGGKLKGPNDPRVPVLSVRAPDGTLRAILVSYACHATVLSFYQWHGDWPGSAQVELERRHPEATALFAAGCGADQNPLPRRTVQIADQYGRELADAADRALNRPMLPVTGRFKSAFEDITLRFASRPTDAELEAARNNKQTNHWATAVSAQIRARGDAILNYAYPVQAWTLGELSWVALGGEVVVDYALRLRKETAGELWVFGYSNDVMGYIPNERVLKEGRYEGDTSMKPYGRPSPWAPGLEEKIVTKAKELVERTR